VAAGLLAEVDQILRDANDAALAYVQWERALLSCYRGETGAVIASIRNLDQEECDMDEGRATCPPVPGPNRRPSASRIDQAEAWPGAVIVAGAIVCLCRWRRRYGWGSRVVRHEAYLGEVKFAHQGDEVRPSEGRRQPPFSLASLVRGGQLVRGLKMQLVMYRPSASAAWADALFGSMLQRSDGPSADEVRTAIAAAARAYGGRGCAERVAQEFGDHPGTAVARMRWARGVVGEVFASPTGAAKEGRRRSPLLPVTGLRRGRLVRT